MEIRPYSTKADEAQLFEMMREEGADWECYYGDTVIEKYKQALATSIVCVAYDGDILCGYLRCRDDDGFGVYVYDLLVRKPYRGGHIGGSLIGYICVKYPEDTIYVMSDADEYYEKQGFVREGSIFKCV